MIDISVIVPIYNVEKYLARCLDSILLHVKSVVKDGKGKFDLRRSLPYVQLGFIHKVFADLLVSEHYAAAYLWAKSIKCLRKAFSLLR